jgi:hypothetical protein
VRQTRGREKKKKKKRKEEKKEKKKGGEKRRDYKTYYSVFLLFLHKSRILIFIKNNMKNTKYILTVISNSV